MSPSSSLHPVLPLSSASAPWCLAGGATAFETGLRALRAGFLDEAKNIFRALLGREHAHPELVLALAETELASGDFLAFDALLEHPPSAISLHPRVRWLRADAALRQGKIAEALALSFDFAERSPRDPLSRFQIARLLWMGGDDREAEVVFLSLAGDPEAGPRACAWAVFCGWKQRHFKEVADLLGVLRRDDVVCEGLREFGSRSLGIPWEPNEIVASEVRRICTEDWERLFLGIGRGRTAPLKQPSLV